MAARRPSASARAPAPSSEAGMDRAPPFALHRVARLLRQRLQQWLAAHEPGLSPEQWFVLYRLHGEDGVAQTELTDPVLDDRPNVTRLLAALEAAALVRRAPCGDDRRRTLVYLTDAGRALVDRLLPSAVAERDRILAGVADDDLARMMASLRQVEANLSAMVPVDPPPPA